METFDGLLGDARSLCEVIEFGTISAAARRLHQSKGAISRRITRLETGLGVRLLTRTARAVHPTEEGMAFHLRTKAALALLDEAADSARGLRDVPRGHLRLTTAIDLGAEFLPPVIAAFRRLYRHITVDVIASDRVIDLSANRIDLALRIGFGALPDQPYQTVELTEVNVGLYAAPSWQSGRPLPSCPADLNDADMLLGEVQGTSPAFPFRDRHGTLSELSGHSVVGASNLAVILALAEAGAGLAALPELVTMRAVQRGTLVRVLPEWSLPHLKLHAISLGGREPPARVRLFREFLVSWLADQGTGAIGGTLA